MLAGVARAPPVALNVGPGTTLGSYRILALVAEGGMGQVFAAEDLRLRRRVALKLLPGHLSQDPQRRHRLEREARAAAALSHPGIVTVHGVEEIDGRVVIVMELVEGKPLSALIARGGLPSPNLLAIAVPLAEAVGAAHLAGVVHRDLKPQNVMVGAPRD